MAAAPDDRADQLGRDVAGHLAPGELARDGQRQRDRRVDVAARDVPDRVHRADDDQHERERDHPELGHREGDLGAGRDHAGRGGRAGAHEHEERGAESLGEKLLGSGGWSCHAVRPRPRAGASHLPWRDGILLETRSTSSNDVSRNVKRGGCLRQEGRSDLPEQIPAPCRHPHRPAGDLVRSNGQGNNERMIHLRLVSPSGIGHRRVTGIRQRTRGLGLRPPAEERGLRPASRSRSWPLWQSWDSRRGAPSGGASAAVPPVALCAELVPV